MNDEQQNGAGNVQTSIDSHKVTQTVQVGKYKVEVIREKCISAASCVAIAPGVFQLDEEGIAQVISQAGGDDDTKLLAAQSCPTAAIIVIDTETGEQVWPVKQ
jgi:ferredoxin